jgi:hypothetical protein
MPDAQIVKPEYRVAKLSGLGFVGLLVGIIIMGRDGFTDLFAPPARLFHEIAYHPRELVTGAIDSLTDSLKRETVVLRFRRSGGTANKDTVSFKRDSVPLLTRLISADTLAILDLQQQKSTYEDAGAEDSVSLVKLRSLIHFQILPGDLVTWESQFEQQWYEWKAMVPYWIRLTVTSQMMIKWGTAQLTVDHDRGNIAFLAKYPEAGTFIFLIMIFFSFCAIALSTSIVTARQIFQFIQHDTRTRFRQYPFYLMWLIILLALGLLIGMLRHSFNDEILIKNIYLMRHLEWSLSWVRFTGYVTGCGCLAGFLYTASVLGYFKDQTRRLEVRKLQQPVNAEVTDELTNELKNLESTYHRLLGFFNKFFYLSATILSLTVLCTGALFNTLNHLSFIRQLSSNWGYSPAPGDYVYLYGGVFTVILLLIYLPARLRFNEIALEMPAPDASATGTGPAAPQPGKSFDFFKDPFSLLNGTLLAASPLLAGVVQSLFNLLTQH